MIDDQLALFATPIVRVSRRGTISERFERFHQANPHVYKHIVAIARRLRAAGAERLGIAQIFEIVRYERLIYVARTEKYGLDNSFRALYVRAIQEREPDLCGLFETRTRRAA